ncbi:MAG: hypothetical protein R3C56_19540 [Pirellulaceae bacterium]
MRVKAAYNIDLYRDKDGKITYDRSEAAMMAMQTMQSLAPVRSQPESSARAPEPLFPGVCDFEFDKAKKLRHIAARLAGRRPMNC